MKSLRELYALWNRLLRGIYLVPLFLYQRLLSPLLPSSCIYSPTCSHYAVGSVQRFGIIRGTLMGTLRILRCNALFLGGEDEVPERFSLRELLSLYPEHLRRRKKRSKTGEGSSSQNTK